MMIAPLIASIVNQASATMIDEFRQASDNRLCISNPFDETFSFDFIGTIGLRHQSFFQIKYSI